MGRELNSIDLTAKQRKTVVELLRRHLPDTTAWAYGSRVKFTSKPKSDLDLVVFAKPDQSLQVAALKEAFEESDLPFRVDLFVWDEVPEKFRKNIEEERVVLAEREDLELPKEWTPYCLGDLTEWSSGGTPSKAKPEFWNGDIPWISASSMKTPLLCDSNLKLTRAGLENGSRLADANSILLLVRGSELHKRIPVGTATIPVSFNQDVKAINACSELRSDYLFYWLTGNEPLLLNKVENTGIGAGKLDTKVLKDLPIALPPLPEQKAIAHVLGALDDKIELNRQMNATLEAMAQALFKSWFVDFDPVIDNALAAGNPIPDELQARASVRESLGDARKPLPEHIQNLFPATFTLTDELGWIPEGWEVAKIGNLAFLNPTAWTKKNAPDFVKYVDLANVKNGRINDVAEYPFKEAPSRARRVLEIGDTIIGTVRPGNRSFALIHEDGLTGSTGFAVMRPNQVRDVEFIYNCLTRGEIIDRFAHLADGAAYPAINASVVADTPIALPFEPILQAYHDITESWMQSVGAREMANRDLAKTRDTLLPKLLSGELRLPLEEVEVAV